MTDAPLTDKLAKFVRLLSSDQDGEVIAAAGAIRRTLLAANLDIHDLARVIEQSKLGTEPARQYTPPPPHHAPPDPTGRSDGTGTRSEWHYNPFYRQRQHPDESTSDFKRRRRAEGFVWPGEEPAVDRQAHARATYCYQYRRTILNGRETEFVANMFEQSLHHHLTPRQAEWLETIWLKCQPFNFDDVT